MTDLIPLTLVALEVDSTAEELARRFANVTLLDSIGRRCLDADTARAAIEQHTATQDRARERRRRDHDRLAAASDVPAQHRRLAALAERDRKLTSADPTMSAAAVMVGGDVADRLDRRGRRLDALFSGRSEGYSISPPRRTKD